MAHVPAAVSPGDGLQRRHGFLPSRTAMPPARPLGVLHAPRTEGPLGRHHLNSTKADFLPLPLSRLRSPTLSYPTVPTWPFTCVPGRVPLQPIPGSVAAKTRNVP